MFTSINSYQFSLLGLGLSRGVIDESRVSGNILFNYNSPKHQTYIAYYVLPMIIMIVVVIPTILTRKLNSL